MARKKSSFYHTRWNRVGLNEQRAAEILGVTVEDVQWFDIEGAPVMAERLLLLWDSKHVGVDGWQGFVFSRGVLCWKKRRYTPDMLKAYCDQQKELDETYARLSWLSTFRGLFTAFGDKVVHEYRHHLRRRGV